MKKLLVSVLAVCMILSLSASSFAAEAVPSYRSPAEIVAALTGRTAESIITERFETGKTYGTIASEAGVLDEFKSENLKTKKNILAEQVANGTLTQEDADTIIAAIEATQAICDGTGMAGIWCANGMGCYPGGSNFGRGQGGRGQGGNGRGMCRGGGMRLRDGSCYAVY